MEPNLNRSKIQAPKIVVSDSDSSDHGALHSSREYSFQEQGDDRTPFLDGNQEANSFHNIPKYSKNKRNVAIGALTIFLILLSVFFILWHRLGKNKTSEPQIVVHAENGAVATELDICSNVGVKILREGGNAVDSAIASAICIGSVNMFSAGIGGGGFMIVRHPNGTAKVFNFRETAPAASFKEMYDGNPLASLFGGLAVSVPGEIAGYGAASKLFGNLPWKRLFKESIEMTRNGFRVPPELANRIERFGDFILKDSDWNFLYPAGTLLLENDILYRKNFSKTLDLIAEIGPEAFYNGSIAKSIVAYVQAHGGILTEDDLASYNVSIEDPVLGWYHGREIITCGPPCSGPALIQALNILEGFELGRKGGMTPQETLTGLTVVASAARTELGDPTDSVADRPAWISKLMSKDFAASLRANTSVTRTFPWQHYNPKYDLPQNHGTTHISIIDKDGMTVSLTSTINLIWGSRLHDSTTGIIFNNEMDDFSQPNNSNAFHLEPSPYNYIRPFKRPMSSSTPTIILSPLSRQVELVLGASGGARILTSVLDAVVKVFDWNMDLLDAVEKPRLHHQLLPDIISMEKGYSANILSYLNRAGHKIEEYPKDKGTAEIQAVRRFETRSGFRLDAVSDSRKKGVAAGMEDGKLR